MANPGRSGALMYGRIAWYSHLAAYLLIAGVIAKLAVNMLSHQETTLSKDVATMIRPIGSTYAVIRGNKIQIGSKELQVDANILQAVIANPALLLFDDEGQLTVIDEQQIRFQWQPPADEKWSPQRTQFDAHCALVSSRDATSAIYRCLDPRNGKLLWSSRVDCDDRFGQAVRSSDGIDGYDVTCPGWLASIGPTAQSVPEVNDAAAVLIVHTSSPQMRLTLSDSRLLVSGAMLEHVPQSTIATMTVDLTQAGLAAAWVDKQLIMSGAPGSEIIAGLQHAQDATAIWLAEPGFTLPTEFVFPPTCGVRDEAAMVAPLWLSATGNSSSGKMVLIERGPHPRITWRSSDASQSTLFILGCRDGMQWLRVRVKTGQDVLWVIDAKTGTTVAAFDLEVDRGRKIPLSDIDIAQLTSTGVLLAEHGRLVEVPWRSDQGAANVPNTTEQEMSSRPSRPRKLRALNALELLTNTLGPLP